MKKIMRVFSRVTILVLSLMLIVTFSIKVSALNGEYKNEFATYNVTSVKNEKDLGYGVLWHRDIATTKVLSSGLAKNGQVNVDVPQQVNILEFNASQDVQLVPYALLDGGSWAAVTVKKAAAQYELRNPGYKVIAAVNGDFFKINNDMKASTGVTISQGEFYKSVSDHGGVNTIAIKNDGNGKQLFNANITQSFPVLTIYNDNDEIIKKININKVNEEPGQNEISLYYPTRIKSYTDGVNKINVNNAWIVSGSISVTTVANSFYGKGKINSYLNTETELRNGQFAVKSNNSEINDLLKENVTIRCQYEYNDPSVEGVENFIGCPWQILKDGQPAVTYANNGDNISYRHPRTILGQKEDGEIVLAVVDGRQNGSNMYGVSGAEMSALMSYYGCVDAWNLDGGGSTTMIVRKQYGWSLSNVFKDDASSEWYITNSPSDGNERNDGNHLFVVVKLPEIKVEISEMGTSFVQFHIALLTDIEKYKNLYVLFEDQYYQVENDMVKITGLKKNCKYSISLYYKDGNDYVDLMTEEKFMTNKDAPKSLQAYVSLLEKNGEEQILIRYKIDESAAVTKIVLTADKDYTSATQTILIPKNVDFYEALTKATIKLYYQINDMYEEQVLELKDFNIQFSYDYFIDEMLNTSQGYFSRIFNN